ncbi:HK97 gp10 family phage protein [Butyrivibrio sp. WCD2001]|uniref:HK97 gp10 family phage protein n=1 Tax=Butyrivibrio sp. WCD2001 TaxID=1280681 RepID=UPI000401BC6D|nr:HK97 gp10 family phage protein [Butyrivibrio sp. WCD2001]
MGNFVRIDQLAGEIVKGLKEYERLTTDDMKKAVKKAGQTARKQISATAPKNTGIYSKSWAVKTTKEFSDSIEVTVHSRNRYRIAHLLENGHAKRGGGRVAARPHIKKAEETAVKQLEKDIKDALGG